MSSPAATSGMLALADFKESMSRWVSGVTVVTTGGPQAQRYGFTASSFSSVSLTPPLVLVCLERSAQCFAAFTEWDWLAVHVLGRDQEHLARRFARKDPDKFADLPTEPGMAGLPLLDGALATLQCQVQDRVPAGDHLVLIAQVRHTRCQEGEPLAYHRRDFCGVSAERWDVEQAGVEQAG
jgi:flavin reductase ActVB